MVRAVSSLLILLVAGCASALPTGRLGYVSPMTAPAVPSVRGFMFAQDRPGCEAAIAQARVELDRAKTSPQIDFGSCRSAVLEPGSDYWAVNRNDIVIGTSVERFCEATAKQVAGAFVRCVPTNLRLIDR